jgi:hypothetical protein
MQIKNKSIAVAALFVVSASAYASSGTAVDVTPTTASFTFAAGSMKNITYSDSSNTVATDIKYISDGKTNFGTYTSTNSFEYLAVHVGGGKGSEELLFDFGSKRVNSLKCVAHETEYYMLSLSKSRTDRPTESFPQRC